MSASLSRGLQVSVRAQGQGVTAKAEFLVTLFFPPSLCNRSLFPSSHLMQQITSLPAPTSASGNFPFPKPLFLAKGKWLCCSVLHKRRNNLENRYVTCLSGLEAHKRYPHLILEVTPDAGASTGLSWPLAIHTQ